MRRRFAMWDIVLGLAIVILASMGLFLAGVTATRRFPRQVCAVLGLAVTAFVVWFALAVHGTLTVARALPLTNAIVLGNCIPPAAALLGGLIVGNPAIPRWRAILLAALLIGSAWRTELSHFYDPAPRAIDRWSLDRVCLQTTPSSCSPCCAVMLLRACGIRSSEAEMIRLCRTGLKGTSPLGLYRGLRLKTDGTPWTVALIGPDFQDLSRSDGTPALVFIRLPPHYDTDGKRVDDGTSLRSQHCVVVYRFTDDGHAVIGDPAKGLRHWKVDRLKHCWTGEGLRLARRKTSGIAGK